MVTSVETATVGPRRSVHLWEFLLELLMDESCSSMIQWTDEMNGEFKLKSSEDVARKWGERKHKDGMNYDKLSRALRYYYSKDIIKKVSGRRFVYKFVPSPEMHAAVNAIKNHMIRLGIKRIPTGPFPHFQLNGEENNNIEKCKQEKLLSPSYHAIRPRSHSPNLEYGRTMSRPSPPLSLSPPSYFNHEKRLPENHIVLGHAYEGRDLTGKMSDCRSIHHAKHYDRYRARLASERELSSRDRELLNKSNPLDDRRSRIASTGDVYSSSQDDRMRELKRFVYENSRQLKENGIHLPSRVSNHTFSNPSPLLSSRESPKPKEIPYHNDIKPKLYPRDRFYSENYISLDNTVLSEDMMKMRARGKHVDQRNCCPDCPTSRRESGSVERHLSPSFRNGCSRLPSHFNQNRITESRTHENGFDMHGYNYRKSPYDMHRHSFSFDTDSLKMRNPSYSSSVNEIKHRPYELVSSRTEADSHNVSNGLPKESYEKSRSPEMKHEESEHLEVASNGDHKLSDSDNEVFISTNSVHESRVKQPSVGSSPPPRVYYYKRYSPMFDVSTQTTSEDFDSSSHMTNNTEEIMKEEKYAPIQTCVITSTDTHKLTFTSVSNGYKSDSYSSRNSTPSSFSSSSPSSLPANAKKSPCNCGFTENSVSNHAENTVVVYPKEMV